MMERKDEIVHEHPDSDIIDSKETTDTIGSNDSPRSIKANNNSGASASSVHGVKGIEDDSAMDPTTTNRQHITKRGVMIGVFVIILVASAITLGVLASKMARDEGDGSKSLFGNRLSNEDGNDVVSSSPSDQPTDVHSTSPSEQPSESPSESPSTEPSQGPSSNPSDTPSASPTSSPSSNPTSTPTTSSPTETPTSFWVEPNPVPRNPPRGYFNYDPDDDDYGPRRWHRVDTSRHFLREFTNNGWGPFEGHLESKDVLDNRCDGPNRRQSPKNLIDTDGCEAHHEIRTRCGSRSLYHDEYERLILPHKLSLVMNRRECLDVESSRCSDSRPPIADYPRYSSGLTAYSDLLNLDIKVPAEHTMEGETFDAEIQMLHTHLDPSPARVSSIGLLLRATSNGFNYEFQQLLDMFQRTYNDHANGCRRRQLKTQQQRHLRRMDGATTMTSSTIDDTHADFNEDSIYRYSNVSSTGFGRQRKVQGVPQELKFDPYSEAFMPGIFFYRYDGSITEPPCLDITWWVMMDPMIISFEQLRQIKHILFTHVDEETCERTSVHNRGQSVARPIFPLGSDREIQKCGPGTFISDEAKGRGPGNICRG